MNEERRRKKVWLLLLLVFIIIIAFIIIFINNNITSSFILNISSYFNVVNFNISKYKQVVYSSREREGNLSYLH